MIFYLEKEMVIGDIIWQMIVVMKQYFMLFDFSIFFMFDNFKEEIYF